MYIVKEDVYKKTIILFCFISLVFSAAVVSTTQAQDNWKAHCEDIRMIQKYLKKDGYNPGRIDGLLGPKTREAIMAYQAEKDLPYHGRITEEVVSRMLSHVKVPEDFSLSYFSGPAHREWGGGIDVTVKDNGDYLVAREKRGTMAAGARDTLAEGRLSPVRMKMLYSQAMNCGVFGLKRHYKNTGIIDGHVQQLHVTANGKSQSVSSSNTYVSGVSCIALALKAAIPSAQKYIR